MRVQLLYFPGCPNAGGARAALLRSLAACGQPPDIEEVDVTVPGTPEHLRAWGSPTILIDGADVGGEREPSGPACRLYGGAEPGARGVPPEAAIRAAIARAAIAVGVGDLLRPPRGGRRGGRAEARARRVS
jgi:hypothetical protein